FAHALHQFILDDGDHRGNAEVGHLDRCIDGVAQSHHGDVEAVRGSAVGCGGSNRVHVASKDVFAHPVSTDVHQLTASRNGSITEKGRLPIPSRSRASSTWSAARSLFQCVPAFTGSAMACAQMAPLTYTKSRSSTSGMDRSPPAHKDSICNCR